MLPHLSFKIGQRLVTFQSSKCERVGIKKWWAKYDGWKIRVVKMFVGKVGFQRFWLAQLQQAEKCGATAPLLLAFYLFDKCQKVKDVDVFLCSCDSWKQMWRTNIGICRNYSLPIIILELTWGIDCWQCFSWQLFLLIGTTHLFLYGAAIAVVMILHTV